MSLRLTSLGLLDILAPLACHHGQVGHQLASIISTASSLTPSEQLHKLPEQCQIKNQVEQQRLGSFATRAAEKQTKGGEETKKREPKLNDLELRNKSFPRCGQLQHRPEIIVIHDDVDGGVETKPNPLESLQGGWQL